MGIYGDLMGFNGILWGFMGFNGILWGFMGMYIEDLMGSNGGLMGFNVENHLLMTNIAMVLMAHRNRWFTVLKHGGSFHGKLLVITKVVIPRRTILCSHRAPCAILTQ